MKAQRAVVAFSAVFVFGVLFSGSALAAGCNGVVEPTRWGCAPWDNNNGPQFPHYKAPQQKKPVAAKPAPPAPRVIPPTTSLTNQKPNAIVAAGGGNLQGKAGLVGNDGASLKPRN